MFKHRYVFVLAASSLLVAASVGAQPATQAVTVTAGVTGIFEFIVVDGCTCGTAFDFGDVDAVGNTTGTSVATVDDANNRTTYLQEAAFVWLLASAPVRTVAVTSTATKTVGTTGADALGRLSIPLSNLEMAWGRFTGTSGTATTALTSMTAGPQTWLTGADVGVGFGAIRPIQTGFIDLRLTVTDLHLIEANEWEIEFTATGS